VLIPNPIVKFPLFSLHFNNVVMAGGPALKIHVSDFLYSQALSHLTWDSITETYLSILCLDTLLNYQ